MAIIFALIAYFLGSICTAVLVCRFMGLPDPRTEGSQNPGATNVLRIAGKQAAVLVFLADALKGFLPVLLARMVGVSGFGLAVVALCAFLGHIYPIFFQFKGGKGVATAIGGIFGLNIFVGLLVVITWAAVLYFSRYSSLAALISFILLPIYILIFSQSAYFVPVVVIMLMLIWRHWPNIQRLRQGIEPKVTL